jgi:hypothetical protein
MDKDAPEIRDARHGAISAREEWPGQVQVIRYCREIPPLR